MGLGVIALRDGVPAAGASSYAVWDGGIEIQIDTRPDLRRRGLALSCGARLILTCLDQGLLPSWDAHDRRSAALAEKLGYPPGPPLPRYLLDQTGPVRKSQDFLTDLIILSQERLQARCAPL